MTTYSSAPALPAFVAPKLKVQWAERRAAELGQHINQFIQAEPSKLKRIHPPGHPTGGYQVYMDKLLPPEIPLTLGDAIHNMRTALDLLANDLVRLNGRSANGAYFPFSKDNDKLDDRIK